MGVGRERCQGEQQQHLWGTLKNVAHSRGVCEPQTQNHMHSPACVLNSLNPVRKRIRFFSSCSKWLEIKTLLLSEPKERHWFFRNLTGRGIRCSLSGCQVKIHVDSYKQSVTPRDALPQLTLVNQGRVSSCLSPVLGKGGTAMTKIICDKP